MKTLMRLVIAIWIASIVAMVGVLLFYAICDNPILILPAFLLGGLAYCLVRLTRCDNDEW